MGYNLCIIVTRISMINPLIQSRWVYLNEFDLERGLKRLNFYQDMRLIFAHRRHVLGVLVVFCQRKVLSS